VFAAQSSRPVPPFRPRLNQPSCRAEVIALLSDGTFLASSRTGIVITRLPSGCNRKHLGDLGLRSSKRSVMFNGVGKWIS
jgi:hypothetical protein